ncbi:2-oxo acid dehydrogenase subunit E2 [candidate division KSB1 bacterium]|nr:2-oxo acid dehydrogenase subunit E2 [candidate division KSB1 bacterium]
MALEFKFPDIGEGIHEGKLLEWYVKPGDQVKEGDPLMKVETDKVVTDIPIPKTGVIAATYGAVNQIIHVGQIIALIAGAGEPLTDPTAAAPPQAAVAKGKDEPVEETGFGVVGQIEVATTDDYLPATGEGMEETALPATHANGGRIAATPVARRIARELGLDITQIRGTGPGGRIMKEDIQRAHELRGKPPVAPAYTAPKILSTPVKPGERTSVEELSQLRKTVAARMAQSKYTAPHATAFEEVEVSRLVALRNEKKDQFAAQGVKLSYMPFIVKAVAMALAQHKKLNCRLDLENNRVLYHHYVNIGLAVDTPDGLIVPVIRDADRRSIVNLAQTIQDLADRARARKLALDEIREGTFTITNYGAITGTHGVPVINFPEVAILGVGRILKTPVVNAQDEVVVGHVQPLSLSFDHRIVDGGDAARFIKDIMASLADPVGMLMQ